MASKIQVRRDTTAGWSQYEIDAPSAGEFCLNTSTNELRIGDGVTAFKDLPAFLTSSALQVSDSYSGTPSVGDLWLNIGECPPELLVYDDCDDPGNPTWKSIGGGTAIDFNVLITDDGDSKPGNILTASATNITGGTAPEEKSYNWLVNGQTVGTEKTLTIVDSFIGQTVLCEVTVAEEDGSKPVTRIATYGKSIGSAMEVTKGVITPTVDVEVGDTLTGSATVTDAAGDVTEVHVWELDGNEVQRGSGATYLTTAAGDVRYRKEATDSYKTVIGDWSDPVTVTAPTAPEATMSGLRFDSAKQTGLSRSAVSSDTWTMSFWAKPGKQTGANCGFLTSLSPNTAAGPNLLNSDNTLRFNDGTTHHIMSASLPENQWAHIVFTAEGDYVTSYVNGNETGSATIVSGQSVSDLIRVGSHESNYYNGYLSEYYFVDGKALEPTAFGKSFDGRWAPLDNTKVKQNIDAAERQHAPGFGDNGFYLPFDKDAGIGNDASGNDNHFADENFGVGGNTDEVWGKYLTGGNGTNAQNSDPNTAFDGSLSGLYRGSANQAMVFDVAGLGLSGNLEIAALTVDEELEFDINDGAVTGTVEARSSIPAAFYSTEFTGTLSKLEIINRAGDWNLAAIKVNGEILRTPLSTDTVLDTPMTNYAVLDADNKHNSSDTIVNGYLTYQASGNSAALGQSTLDFSSGKYYFEVNFFYTNTAIEGLIGIRGTSDANYDNSYVYYGQDGHKYGPGFVSQGSYGDTFTTGDVIGAAVNMDDGTITFYKNGVSQGVAFTGISGTYRLLAGKGGGDGGGYHINYGQQPYVHTPPDGYGGLYQTWEEYARTTLGYLQDRITKLEGNNSQLREKVQQALTRIAAIESDEITDDATSNALLALVADLSSRVAALEADHDTLMGNSGGGY